MVIFSAIAVFSALGFSVYCFLIQAAYWWIFRWFGEKKSVCYAQIFCGVPSNQSYREGRT